MNDTSRNGAALPLELEDEEFVSDEAVESAALAGAAAVQRLVAERNNLRNRLAAQQREMAAMRGINEELKRRLYTLHQRYVEVAKRVVGQLEMFDGTIREVLQQGPNGAAAPREAAPAADQAAAAAAASLTKRLAEAAPQAVSHAAEDEESAAPQAKS